MYDILAGVVSKISANRSRRRRFRICRAYEFADFCHCALAFKHENYYRPPAHESGERRIIGFVGDVRVVFGENIGAEFRHFARADVESGVEEAFENLGHEFFLHAVGLEDY